MNCKSCKHWDNKTNVTRFYTQKDKENKSTFGYCEKINKGYGWDQDSEGNITDGNRNIYDREAIVEFDEGWGIITGQNFGCVLYSNGD